MYDDERPFDYPGSQPEIIMCDECGLRIAEKTWGEYELCVRCYSDTTVEPDEPDEPFEDPFYRTNHYDITKTRP